MPKPKNDDKQRILDAIDFRLYYDSRVDRLKPISGSNQALGICPFHADKKNSFSIDLESGLWNCKGCGAKGDVFTFYALNFNFDIVKQFPEVLAGLGQQMGVDVKGKKKKTSKKQAESPGFIPQETVDQLHEVLLADAVILEALQKKRGLTLETINTYHLGYAKKRGRITVPVYDSMGKCFNIRCYSSTAEFKM